MTSAARVIAVTSESEIDELLDEAERAPILLEREGVLYRLARANTEPDDIWANYDPEAVRKALDETVGSWADLDADQLIADIYRWRAEGSRPIDRP